MLKELGIYFGIVSVFFILITGVFAQEEQAKYNFGSAQGAKEVEISPGDTVTAKLYFYNIYGNRITHISLEVLDRPSDWEVTLIPELHNTTVNVSGITTTVEENLFVEPSDAEEEIPADVPEGIEYISSSVGFIGAKPVLININVPEDEQIGNEFTITLSATASWLGQTGAVAVQQNRDFEYTIRVVSKTFEETIIEEPIVPQGEQTQELLEPFLEGPQDVGITGFIVSNATSIGIIVILLVLLMYFGFIRKK